MTLVTRRAKLDDVDAIIELAVESVLRDPIPVVIDRQAMRDTMMPLFNPAHFLWVTERHGVVVAAFAAQVQPSFWYRGKQCAVLLHYSRVAGGELPLLREFVRWLKPRSGIKVAVAELEPNTDPRLVKWLRRMGFDRVSQNVCFVRNPAP